MRLHRADDAMMRRIRPLSSRHDIGGSGNSRMRALKTEVEIPSILRLPHVRVSVVLFPVLFVVLGVG